MCSDTLLYLFIYIYIFIYLFISLIPKIHSSSSRNYPHFMEPGVLLPHSQSPPLAPILSQTNPIHVLPIDLCKIHFNIILPSTPRCSKVYFLQVSPPKPCMPFSSPLFMTHDISWHMTCPSHSSATWSTQVFKMSSFSVSIPHFVVCYWQ